LSTGIGKEMQQDFYVVNWDKDSLYIDPSRIFVQAFSNSDKKSRIYVEANNQLV
jgi:hypothetical protein